MPDSSWKQFEVGGHWLAKRKDTGNYYIYWYDTRYGGNRRVTTSTRDFERAKLKLIQWVQEVNRPEDQREEEVPLATVLDYYLRTRVPKQACSSRDTACRAASRLIQFFEENDVHFVSQFKWQVQEDYMAWREKVGKIADGTITREMVVMRAALNWYHARGHLKTVPKIHARPMPPARERFLTANEIQRLISECRHTHLQRFIYLALHTLARPRAILDLEVSQVDLTTNRINFLKPGQRQSTKRKPIVPISKTLRPMLKLAIEESCSGYVIEFAGKPIKSIKRAFNATRDRAGLGTDVIPYTLRHTGATLLASKGVDLRTIAGMLGHSQEKTTEIYAKHHPSFLHKATDAMDGIFLEIDCANTVPEAVDKNLLDSAKT